jgi:serine/threonine protein kinase
MPSKLDKYEILRTLGSGAFSKVKLGYRSDKNEYYAIKIHREDNPHFNTKTREIIMNEVKTIIKLQHPNIINIVEYIEEATVEKADGTKYNVVCVIVEEIASSGELFFFIANSGHFSENYARYFFS